MNSVTKISGAWGGIYSWGEGFHCGMGEKWDNFWNNWERYKKENTIIYWDMAIKEDTPYLFSLYGCIYVHPMDFETFLKGFNKGAIKELERICNDVANCCDSSFHMSVDKGVWNRE